MHNPHSPTLSGVHSRTTEQTEFALMIGATTGARAAKRSEYHGEHTGMRNRDEEGRK